MRRSFIICTLILLLALCTNAQQNKYSSKEGVAKPSAMLDNAQLACHLARYGYYHKSPTALVEAARILADQPFRKADISNVTAGKGSEGRKHTRPIETESEKLLEDAKKMCTNDKELAFVENAIQELSRANSKGAKSGPSMVQGRVYGNNEIVYHINISGKGKMEIRISGDGTSDLDLDVFYGENGEQQVSDSGPGDECSVIFTPIKDQTVKVVVKNWGSAYNDFTLYYN